MDTLTQLNTIYQYVTTSPHSSFYRDFYGPDRPAAITSYADWEALPILHKADLERVSLADKTFTPWVDVETIRMSSGTTSTRMLVTHKGNHTPLRQWFPKNFVPTGHMDFYPVQGMMQADRDELGQHFPVLSGDPTQGAVCVALAKAARVNSLSIFVHNLLQILPDFQQSTQRLQIEHILLFGEPLTPQQNRDIRDTFPNARIYITYGISEANGLITEPALLASGQPVLYQTGPDHYFEHADSSSMFPNTGTVLLTTLYVPQLTLPLLRYRTGDIARAHHMEDNLRYELIGRQDYDVLKLPHGAMLYKDQLIAALKDVTTNTVPVFAAHFYTYKNNTHKPYLELIVPKATPPIDRKKLENVLRLNNTRYYSDYLTDGKYDPIQISYTLQSTTHTKKAKQLFLHQESEQTE